MSARFRMFLVPALGLACATAGRGNPHGRAPAPCPPPSGCAPKVVVEIPPPEVTFKTAGPVCVKAPAGACAKPGYQCFPYTFPGAAAPGYALAPAQGYMMAPAPAMMAPVMMAPAQGFAPQGFAPQGFAPQGFALAPAQGFAPQGYAPQGFAPQGMAAPGCGSGAFGLPGAASLESQAAAMRAFEQSELRLRLAAMRKEYADLSGRATAAGLAAQPGLGAAAAPGGAAEPGGDPFLQELAKVRRELTGLQALVLDHHQAIGNYGGVLERHVDTLAGFNAQKTVRSEIARLEGLIGKPATTTPAPMTTTGPAAPTPMTAPPPRTNPAPVRPATPAPTAPPKSDALPPVVPVNPIPLPGIPPPPSANPNGR